MADSTDRDQLASSEATDLDLHRLQRQDISGFSRTMFHPIIFFIRMVALLRARCNEKEMKVKPATSFKLLTIFIHKKIRQDSKQNNVSKQYLSSLCHKVPQNNPQEFIKQILSISVSDPTI